MSEGTAGSPGRSLRSTRTPPQRASHRPIRRQDWKDLVWPIVKRLPAYVRLAWALGRDPAIPRRHKLVLYSAVAYSVSPIAAAIGVVPLIGQVDNILLLLLGIQQILRASGPRLTARHVARAGLTETQVSEDLHTLRGVVIRAVAAAGQPVGAGARFAGHVAAGFLRRTALRAAGRPRKRPTPRLTA